MARIIAEAGVRLVVDGKGLALEMRSAIRRALQEASASQADLPSPTHRMADDSERDADRMDGSFRRISAGILGVARSAAGAAVSGGKLLLIGTAAVGALAGVTQLVVGMGALVSAAAQAAGVVGLLPAIFAAFKASTFAIQLGLTGMGDAMSAIASGDAAAFDAATKNMSGSARGFAQAVRDVKPAFDEMRLDVQESLFQGLAEVVKPLANTYLPIATAGFQGVARQAGAAAKETAEFLLQGAQVQKVSVFSAMLQTSFGNLAGALRPAVGALLDLVSTGSTFLPGLTAQLGNWATQFSNRISEAAKSGELAAFFQRSIDALRTLGSIFGNVFGAIKNIIGSANAEGAGFLQRIQEITQRFEDFTGSVDGQDAFGGFFETMRRVVESLGPAFFSLITIIGRDFLPILADIAEIIGPVLKPLFEVFGRLLQSLRPLIQAIANAFATALEALGPFFDALGKAITEAMPVLGPMIQDIGEAFANLFEAMVPLAPLFVELLEAILPILPPFIQMIADIMPSIIDLIKALMPLIQAWVDMMVQLIPVIAPIVNFLADIFIPIIQAVVWVISGLLDIVTAVFTGIWNVITTVLGAVADFFVGIWNDITSQVSAAWTAISDFFSGGISGIVSKVGQFATDLWNNFTSAMSNVGKAVSDGIGNVVDWFAALPGRVFGAIGDFFGSMFQMGKDLVLGLWNGIKSMVQRVIDAVTGMVDDAISAAKHILGVASPSKVFTTIGQQVAQGLTLGIQHGTAAAAQAAADMAQAVTDAASFAPQVAITAPTSADLLTARQAGAEVPIIQQTNIMRPGTDVNQFSHLVLKRGLGDMLSGASTLGVSRRAVQAGVNDQWVNA